MAAPIATFRKLLNFHIKIPFTARFGSCFSHKPGRLCVNIQTCQINSHCKFSNQKKTWFKTFTWRRIGGLTAAAAFVGACGLRYAAIPFIPGGESVGGDVRQSSGINVIADVVEKVAPAVVHLEIKGIHPFHGRQTTMSHGSGFIIRSNGVIMTNAHVVANKQTVVVKLYDGRTFEGVVQVVDPVSDLATINIKAKDLPTIKLGDSARLRPGEWVVAMGSPLSLNNTVTAGIISSVNRGSQELGIHNRDIEYIQTDAVINFGNSGGPLINLDGEAIGINTMKVTTGISFAIPSDFAKQFLKRADDFTKRRDTKGDLSSESKYPLEPERRRYIGLTMLALTPSLIIEYKQKIRDFPDIHAGVMVYKIIVGSPAYVAGLRPGDIIIAINGDAVNATADVHSAVNTSNEITAKVRRGQAVLTFKIQPEIV